MDINKITLNAFRADFTDAVKQLESKYGVEITPGKIGYSTNEFNLKIEVKNKDSQGNVVDDSFGIYASMFDLPADCLNKEFTAANGKRLKIVGLNPRRHKNPVELKGVDDNKNYKSSASYVKLFLK